MSRLVGAYVCPRGVHAVEVKATRAGVEVLRSFELGGRLASADDAARCLARALDNNGIVAADVAVVARGFEIGHHTLALPPAREDMLAPIIEREMRRLEPQLTDAAIGWMPLPDEEQATDQPSQRQFLVAAAPRATVARFESSLQESGHTLLHLTALPAAFQRITEQFDAQHATTAQLVPLPDGLFLGLYLGGGVRIAIEPPLQEQDALEGPAMAEETELGATYVRQQFRGAQVERAVIVGPAMLWPDTQSMLIDRLGIPVERLDVDGLSAASIAALGAVLDARSPAPLSLGGTVAHRKEREKQAVVRNTAFAAVAAVVVVAAWSVFQALDARRSDEQLRQARARLEQLSANIGPIRQTADQRRLVRDAGGLVRLSVADRTELQNALVAISGGILGPIRLDSLALERGSSGWIAALAGSATGATSGGAVQALHDFYRVLPRRLVLEELALEQMSYVDTTAADGTGARVAFQLSFVVPGAKD
ncbi:MAG TPA: hypothetical protein VFO66_11375 [Gemmatimonadaceae bacterium]|nr:hypothetical protein [Gemmatimonadaceae bacterium]